MQVVRDGILLCDDCLFAAVNGDTSSLDYHYGKDEAAQRLADIEAGLAKLGPHLVPAFDSETNQGIDEHSTHPCDCCGTRLHGQRHEFAILGEEPKPTYLNPATVTAKRQSEPPPNRSRTGYGSRLPTSWELRLADNRWRRVYVMQWSNAGTAYVLVGGKPHLLGTYDPAHDAAPEAK